MNDSSAKEQRLNEKIERRKYTPYKFSGKSYSFDYNQEKLIVDGLREWQDFYFENAGWIFMQMSK